MLYLCLGSTSSLEKFKVRSIISSVDKDGNVLDDNKEAVVTIRRKDSDKFEGQSKGSTGWFNIDHEFFLIKISTLEPDLY